MTRLRDRHRRGPLLAAAAVAITVCLLTYAALAPHLLPRPLGADRVSPGCVYFAEGEEGLDLLPVGSTRLPTLIAGRTAPTARPAPAPPILERPVDHPRAPPRSPVSV